ncbi:hypothetical protein NOCA2530026 [metagenome]|uniref:Uncharacterized protein n=1 Tax=metagenome TaxID=256318 RepID=A0A2P2C9K4_9ZZZZ
MSQLLKDLMHDEADRIEVRPAPITAIVTGGRRRRTVRRTQVLVAVAASVAIIVGGSIGVNRLLADGGGGVAPDPADTPTAPVQTTDPSVPATGQPLVVDGSGVSTLPFGTPEDTVQASLEEQLGVPDVRLGPEEYARIPGNQGFFRDAQDNLSPSWGHRFTSVSCWGALCVIYGGDQAGSSQLRGWELAQFNRWSEGGRVKDLTTPDASLADSGVGLGDTWKELHAAFPGTRVGDAEGGSLSIRDTPWPGIFDGVAEWRLEGYWDAERPGFAPAGATVTRLSGGEGPQPGCC